MSVVDYCPTHHTPMGVHGCRVCRNQPVPMPEWVKQLMVELGLRPAVTPTRHNDQDNNAQGGQRS